MKTIFLDALEGKNRGRPPVWLMRQAGRYMPDYRALRAKHSLYDLFFTPELAAEITLMPERQLGVDAAILFSDITAIAPALGLNLSFCEGPVIAPWVELGRDLTALEPIYEAVRRVKRESTVPLIGFCGGPFTVASYLLDMTRTFEWMRRSPESFEEMLNQIVDVSIAYLKGQIAAGADAIQIFDSWANQLEGESFHRYSLGPLKKIVEAIDVPVIVYMRGSGKRAKEIASIGAHVSVDWERMLSDVRKEVSCTLQGNLDPDLLFKPVEEIKRCVTEVLEEMRGDPRFIVNLGHGVKVGTPFEGVKAFVQAVREWQ